MENLLKQIEELRERVADTWRLLDIDRKKAAAKEKKAAMNAPDFWDDRERAVSISRGAEELEREVHEWEAFKQEVTDLYELTVEVAKEGDTSFEAEVRAQYDDLLKRFEKLEFYILFSGKHDEANAILSLHAGTGGVDAQDWAEMLLRMYLRFAEKMGWRAEVIDRTSGNEAGLKSATVRVAGRHAYGYLKSESGVHRLVRISPFDAEAMRHTSFALLEVIPELPETAEIDLKSEDVKIDVFRSSGPGGQSVNTTDSAVRLTHLPTGIVINCQNERSQHQNRETAFKILKSKLYLLEEEKRGQEELKLRGEAQKAEWGKQIRSYVLQPYKLVKDHRTDHETQDTEAVLDGELVPFAESYLRWLKARTTD